MKKSDDCIKKSVRAKKVEPESKSEVVCEFAGLLICAVKCVDGQTTDIPLGDGAELFLNQGGFCQICKNKFGIYASFHIPEGNYIVIPNGKYKHEGNYHSIRYDDGLFVFEENEAYYEESVTAIYDFNVKMDQLNKGIAAANHIINILEDLMSEDDIDEDT